MVGSKMRCVHVQGLATKRCIRRHVRRVHEGIKENAKDKICQQCGKPFRVTYIYAYLFISIFKGFQKSMLVLKFKNLSIAFRTLLSGEIRGSSNSKLDCKFYLTSSLLRSAFDDMAGTMQASHNPEFDS